MNTKHSLQELVPIAIGMYGSLSQKAFKGELGIYKSQKAVQV